MKSSLSRIAVSISALAFLAFILVLSTPEPAFSRAGGGHSYSSGGSSSRSSRSSGSSTSTSNKSSHRHSRGRGAPVPLNATEKNLLLMVFIVGGILIALKLYAEHRQNQEIESISAGIAKKPSRLRNQSSSEMAKAARAMGERDPKWNSALFLERVKKGFSQVQAAWSNQDLSSAQGFLSDGVYERFALQIQEQKSDCIRDHMENLRILHARIMQIENDSQFDTVHVSIRASAVNYRVSLLDNRRLDGHADAEEFEEVWSFLRRPGSKTLEKPGLIEGVCPSCGAPIEVVRSAKCKYCQTFLRSGEYDWVLAEITQACEWAPVESKTRPGIARLMQLDPGFSVQQIEDRASVMFWRYYTAFRLGRVDPLMRHAHPEFIEKLRPRLTPKSDGSRMFYREAAVGSVSVLAASFAEPASSGESFDRIPVEVRWSWKSAEKSATGSLKNTSLYPMNTTQVFILTRKSGVKGNISFALSSNCCKNCGAPESDTAGVVCAYCQAPLNEGSQDWVLEQITGPGTPEVLSLLREQPTAATPDAAAESPVSNRPDSGERIRGTADALRWMAHIMFADRKVEKSELEMLKQYARTCGVPQAKFNEIVHAANAGEALPQTGTTPREIAGVYRELVRFALADGTISDAEMKLLQKFGRCGKMSPEEMDHILETEKSTIL